MSALTPMRMRAILYRLGCSDWYNHVAYILNKLGVPPPIMSPKLEETLFNLFNETQEPYERHCPDDRVNFLHYSYVGYKLCELLNEHRYLPLFRMLQDRQKLNEQDVIWKKICKDLDWKFIRTDV